MVELEGLACRTPCGLRDNKRARWLWRTQLDCFEVVSCPPLQKIIAALTSLLYFLPKKYNKDFLIKEKYNKVDLTAKGRFK
jgi:hypothetical protein